MLQAVSEMQTVAHIGTSGFKPVSNSGYSLLSYKTHSLQLCTTLKSSISSAADTLFNTQPIYLGIEASVTEVLLMAVTAVRELTLLPGDTAICKKIHSS